MQLTISTDQKIINSLLLNASFIDNLGLMHGKMGISICFYHLARQTGNKIYEVYAGELIDEIYDEITIHTPVDFENGLAGIGWGIEHLTQDGFIEANTDVVLKEFDNRILNELFTNAPQNIDVLNGLTGIGAYLFKRMKNTGSNYEKNTTLTKSLIHIVDELAHKTLNYVEISKEPPKTSKTGQTFQTSTNIGTSNHLSNPHLINHRTLEPSFSFDLTWNYPILLFFIFQVYEQQIHNSKTAEIIQGLIEPLAEQYNFPRLQSNRLLLALSLLKLQSINMQSSSETQNHLNKLSNPQTFGVSNTHTIIKHLLPGINRNTIGSELPRNNITLRYGTSGIAWIYCQLYQLTGDDLFRKEAEYWRNQTLSFKDINEIVIVEQKEKDSTLGLLEGLAGIFFT